MKTIEMSKEEVQKVLDEIEWSEVHYLTVFEDYGSTIHVKTDGTFFVLGSGTYLRDYSEILGTIPVVGYGSIDHWDYLDGWGEWDRENETFLTDDGRTLSIKEAIEECIEVGEWQTFIADWQKSLLEQWQEDVENEEERKRLQEAQEIWEKEICL
jgi:hypothetical protein